MKKALILFLLLSFVTTVYSSSVLEEFQNNSIQIIAIEEDAKGKLFTIAINDPVWTETGMEHEEQIAEYPGESFLDLSGLPQIPVIGRTIRLPLTGGAHVEIIESHYSTLDNIDYALSLENQDSEAFAEFDPSMDRWFPEEIVVVDEPAILKDFRVANVTTYPVQVNPARREVRVYDRLEYRIDYDLSSDENCLESWPMRLSETFLPYYRQFLDWSETELNQYEIYRGSVQLVCKQSCLDDMESWITWKKQKGWEIELLTEAHVDSWTRLAIKSELQTRYNNADIKFDHIVIVGDATGLISTPPGSGNGYGAGDHPYGLLAGTDQLMDVTIGRISVNSYSELAAYVRKVLFYEKNPSQANTGWYKRGSVAAGSGASGISTVFTARYARQAMIDAGYTQVDTAYYNDGEGNVNSRIINQINNGVSFHLYRGFAGTGINTTEIDGLRNYFMLPVVVDITCGRGDWAGELSINEAYMRAGNVNTPRGAIGAISTATLATHTRFNNALSGGAIESVFVHKNPTIGQMLVSAKFNMWQNFDSYQDDQICDFNRWLNLMGDPTVWIFTDVPESLFVDVSSEIELGSRGIEVNVTDETGPVEDAWVTFYKSDSNEEIISRTVTDANGYALLDIRCEYPDEAVVTATAYNHKPKQKDILIVTPEEKIGVIDFSILDDGTGGTHGNSNGIAEYGETVGITYRLRNYGQSTQTNISLTATSEDEFISSVSGTSTLSSLQSGVSAEMLSPILIEIDEAIPNNWISVLNLTITSSENSSEDILGLKVNAPCLVYEGSNGAILPGQSGTVSFDIRNVGESNSQNAALYLEVDEGLEEWVTITGATGSLQQLDVGHSGVTTDFAVTVNALAFKGFQANATLIAEYPNGRVKNIPVQISLGHKSHNDPEGPDQYGYFAFEDTDVNYLMSPSYNWIEINPHIEEAQYLGNDLNLADTGVDQDVSIVLSLPFEFTYYGETYTTITVCSNGWLAMGSQGGMALQRNWVIPSPLGPSAMIAPFWNDHTIRNENSGVYSYYVEEEGKFIIEWYDVSDIQGMGGCTFQVVLMENRVGFPTPTGDNEFLFQYETISPAHGYMSDVPYFTTGIENASQQDGIMLSYYNTPSGGSSPIESGKSILFSTRSSFTSGDVTGTVTHMSDQSPVEGVIVRSNTLGTVDTTDAAGEFSIMVAAGTCDIIFHKSGYISHIEENVEVPENGSVTVNVEMSRPVLIITPEELFFELEPNDYETQTITMENQGDAALSYNLEKWARDPESGIGGEVGDQIDFVNLPDDYTYTDFCTQGNRIWVVGRDYTSYDNSIRIFDWNGFLIDTDRIEFSSNFTEIQVHDEVVILGSDSELMFMHYDGDYSLDSTKSFPDQTWQTVFSIDYENARIYQASYSTLFEYNFECQLVNQYEFPETVIMGIDVLPEASDGYRIHMVYQTIEDGHYVEKVVRFNPETSITEVMFYNDLGGSLLDGGFALIKSSDGIRIKAGILMPRHPIGIGVFEYINNLDWIVLDHMNGVINPGETQNMEVGIDASRLNPENNFNAWINIQNNAIGGSMAVPLTVHVVSSDIEEDNNVPVEWELEKVYPNPFNPDATVKFSLVEAVPVKARLFNVLGQQVAELVDCPMQAGTHTLTINGESLASGVYFLKFNAGPISSVQKVVLMK